MKFMIVLYVVCMFYTVYSVDDGRVDEQTHLIQKRWVPVTATPNCLYSWTYKQLNESLNQNNTLVRIAQNVHPQMFQVMHCLDTGNASSCRGMDETRYESKCTVTQSLHLAFVCKSSVDCVSRNHYDYIYVDTGCECYVKEKAVGPSL